jgi:hypothetical protein
MKQLCPFTEQHLRCDVMIFLLVFGCLRRMQNFEDLPFASGVQAFHSH